MPKSDLDVESLTDETVASGQVAVNKVQRRHVLDPGGHLTGDVYQLRQRQLLPLHDRRRTGTGSRRL